MESFTQNSVAEALNTFGEPKWGPMGKDVYTRTYSRTLDEGKETWADTVDRVTSTIEDPDERQRVAEMIYSFDMLPAGRHLWITGTGLPYVRNCFRAPFSERLADHFDFMGSQLMTGGGVGANYSAEYLAKSPSIGSLGGLYISIPEGHEDHELVRAACNDVFIDTNLFETNFYNDPSAVRLNVKDTREGWVEAWSLLFDHATGENPHRDIYIDLGEVRPRGELIKTFGGTASGPDPLASSLLNIFKVLKRAEGRHLSSIEAMECDHYLAEAIVAGGARRSARMSIVHWNDPNIFEFIECKNDHMLHWSTNISVEVDDEFFRHLNDGKQHAIDVATRVVTGMIHNGEPGFYNSSLSSIGERGDVRSTNPCGEITLEEGESCNIGSVNLAAFGTDDDGALEAFRLMARFLIRATLITPDHNLTAMVEAKNRRIGVGFFGFQEWAAAHGIAYSDIPNSQLLADKLKAFKNEVRRTADEYADELGIPRAIKVTAIAPNGTISILPGVQAGIHPVMAKYFKRRVRFTDGDPLIDKAKAEGRHTEPCVYAKNTIVVEHIVRDSILDKYDEAIIQDASEVSLDDQLAVLEFVSSNFTDGKDGNAVSFTANIPQDELRDSSAIYDSVMSRLPNVKGVTIFPSQTRPQQPIEAITVEEYNEYHGIVDEGSSMDGDACSIGGACPIR